MLSHTQILKCDAIMKQISMDVTNFEKNKNQQEIDIK